MKISKGGYRKMITIEKLNLLMQYIERQNINIVYADTTASGINAIYFERQGKEFIVLNENIKDTEQEVQELQQAIGICIMYREKQHIPKDNQIEETA